MEATSGMNADLAHEHKASKGDQEVTAADEWSWIPGNVPTEGLLSGLEAADEILTQHPPARMRHSPGTANDDYPKDSATGPQLATAWDFSECGNPSADPWLGRWRVRSGARVRSGGARDPARIRSRPR